MPEETEFIDHSRTNKIPAGVIIAYAGNTIPRGWLLCDGTRYNRDDRIDGLRLSELFDSIRNNWGACGTDGDFLVPDLAGYFLRGATCGIDHVDRGRRDPDWKSRFSLHEGGGTAEEVGSFQNDEFEKHNHGIDRSKDDCAAHSKYERKVWEYGSGDRTKTHSSGGNETRPKNAYVHWIIKI